MLTLMIFPKLWSAGWRPWNMTKIEVRWNPGMGATILVDWTGGPAAPPVEEEKMR